MNTDPVLLEIVEGTLASIEREVETAIGRTARSPMIRDAHDFRAGIHDRRLRKLTGRSYSALVHPVVRDYPLSTMRPGDVFFHNDVYLSEGGIGHLPDLCVTVPVFHDGDVVAFVQAFGHHDDIGGGVPGSMPSRATSVFEEGLMVPPIRLWESGRPNEAAIKIMTRNSRMPESLAADLDAECSACLMGAGRLAELFVRYGRSTVEDCFDAIIDNTTRAFRTEILAKVPDGTYVWEDYAEHDGVDPPRLHAQRITLTKAADRLVLDFTGTSPQARGPINHAGNYGGGSGGRPYADGEDTVHVVPDSRNIPVEFAESRWPFVVERLGLAVDSGGPGRYRGGLGYDKHIRMLRDAHFMSIADRSLLACWGVRGGRAGRPFSVVIDPGGPNERAVDALADAEPVRADEVIRIRTTGGGGWGDPLDRPYADVERDVRWGKVSVAGARDDYGVVLGDPAATEALRKQRRTRDQPFFDRGPGYQVLAGRRHAEVDWP